MKLIVDLINESGFAGMRYSISNTCLLYTSSTFKFYVTHFFQAIMPTIKKALKAGFKTIIITALRDAEDWVQYSFT